jgi:NAD(P)-dependent dehydrogenase (short-subunit alcohol dehydrogenase family)
VQKDRNASPEVVVITGGSAGVGRATAREFAKRGARVAVLARGADGLAGAKKDIEELGGEALTLETDVADPAQVEAAAAQVEGNWGRIDVWVNDAMTSVFAPLTKMTPEDFRRVTEVTYLGVVYGTMAALKRMLPANRGTIVQVGSALAYRSIPLQSAYCGAKHAIHGFTDSVRSELIHQKSAVHITMVQLPGVNTPQFDWVKSELPHRSRPLGTPYQPEIPAQAIYWAAHNRRREVYVGMPAAEAIVGNKIFPSLLDKYLAKVGFKGQQTNEPRQQSAAYNLWKPVAGDHGAHGRFDSIARTWSPELWFTMHRRKILCGAAMVAATIAHLIYYRGHILPRSWRSTTA